MARNKEARYLYDLTKGRQGVFVEKVTHNDSGEPIEADNKDLDGDVCQIKYYPTVDGPKRLPTFLKSLLGSREPVTTTQKFPVDAVYPLTLDDRIPGQPREVIVVEEDEYGNSLVMDKIGKKHDRKISNMKERLQRVRREKALGDIQSSKEEEDDDSDMRRGRRENPERDEYLGGYRPDR